MKSYDKIYLHCCSELKEFYLRNLVGESVFGLFNKWYAFNEDMERSKKTPVCILGFAACFSENLFLSIRKY